MLSSTIKQQNILQVSKRKEVAFKVAVVDRDFLSSCMLVNALAQGPKYEAIALESSDALRVLGATKVDLVIIGQDLNSKIEGGFELASQLSRAHPEVYLFILLNQSTRETVIRAFHSGARAVLNRRESMEELLNCVEHLRDGSIWAGREESSILLEVLRSIPALSTSFTKNESNPLSKRELQVVQCAARGKSNKAIATELLLSEHTVKNYLFRAFEKLGVSSRVELLFHLTLHGQHFGPSRADAEDAFTAKLA